MIWIYLPSHTSHLQLPACSRLPHLFAFRLSDPLCPLIREEKQGSSFPGATVVLRVSPRQYSLHVPDRYACTLPLIFCCSKAFRFCMYPSQLIDRSASHLELIWSYCLRLQGAVVISASQQRLSLQLRRQLLHRCATTEQSHLYNAFNIAGHIAHQRIHE